MVCDQIYRMYTKVKIEYGSPVYASAAKTTLDELNPIVTEALRTVTGAFKSTQRETFHVLGHSTERSTKNPKNETQFVVT